MRLAAALAVAAAPLSAASHAADLAAGKTLFDHCKICHATGAGKPSTVGPNLHGLFGRKAGTLPGFGYSEAMKKSNIVWDDKTLAEYLRDPRGFIPDNHMAFPGIKDDKELADLIAYLHQVTQ